MGYQIEINKAKDQKVESRLERLNQLLQKEVNLFGSGIKNQQKEHFYSELTLLINAGIPLKEAIESFVNQLNKNSKNSPFEKLLSELKKGKSFKEAAEGLSAFTNFEIQSIGIGEQSGRLNEILEELTTFFSNRVKNKRLLIGALTYPMIIGFTAILVLVFMLKYVVPMFADIFKQNKVDLPAITEFIVSLSELVQKGGWWIFLGIVGFFVVLGWLIKQNQIRTSLQHFMLRIPVIGEYTRLSISARFSNSLRLTTLSGIPLVHGLEMAKSTIDFAPFNRSIEKVIDGVIRGGNLSDEVSKVSFFDSRMTSLLKVGESTSDNALIFSNLADYYNKKIEQQSKLFTSLLEPFIIVFVGVFVGIVLISMYLPMFQLGQVLG